MTKRTIIVFKESLLQSILSDAFTFGFALLLLWASWGSMGWTFISGCVLLVFLSAKATMMTSDTTKKFNSIDDLQSWIDKQRESTK